VYNGLLVRPDVALATQAMVRDLYTQIQVVRVVAGVDMVTAAFTGRIAATSGGVGGVAVQVVQGNTAQVQYVMPVPAYTDIQTDDAVWSGDLRFRVVTVLWYAHGGQAVLTAVQ